MSPTVGSRKVGFWWSLYHDQSKEPDGGQGMVLRIIQAFTSGVVDGGFACMECRSLGVDFVFRIWILGPCLSECRFRAWQHVAGVLLGCAFKPGGWVGGGA